MKEIKAGTKFTEEGWVEAEKVKAVPDANFEHLVGLFVDESGAGNIANIDRFLEFVNGYKVKVHIEVIDVPENRPDNTKIPAPDGYCAKCGRRIH